MSFSKENTPITAKMHVIFIGSNWWSTFFSPGISFLLKLYREDLPLEVFNNLSGFSQKTSSIKFLSSIRHYPFSTSTGNWTFKVNSRNTITRCEICSKLTIKTPERRLASFCYLCCQLWTYFTPCSSASIVNFEQENSDWVRNRLLAYY